MGWAATKRHCAASRQAVTPFVAHAFRRHNTPLLRQCTLPLPSPSFLALPALPFPVPHPIFSRPQQGKGPKPTKNDTPGSWRIWATQVPLFGQEQSKVQNRYNTSDKATTNPTIITMLFGPISCSYIRYKSNYYYEVYFIQFMLFTLRHANYGHYIRTTGTISSIYNQ